ncbi:MAG: bifunctional methylenetetrahydrofolate dehydrogenase/methenyltetrahydrofolate cyclohydrolase FolD [Spirochaetales bacterium]
MKQPVKVWYKGWVELLDGRKISQQIRAEIKQEVDSLKQASIVPGLAVILVGEDPASQTYVNAKEKACAELGIRSFDHRLPSSTSKEEILRLIEAFNQNPEVDGILVQLPLPKGLPEKEILEAIHPAKDVDGFHPMNLGKLLLGEEGVVPCTPLGILKLLQYGKVQTSGKHAVILGRGITVGRPLANLLSRKNKGANATVTLCHTGTPDFSVFTKQADILIAAVGVPHLVKGAMVKEGAVVIDVGVNRIPDPAKKAGFRLLGDVEFESVAPKASKITPVPGGVGPMTITMLLYNTVRSAQNRLNRNV